MQQEGSLVPFIPLVGISLQQRESGKKLELSVPAQDETAIKTWLRSKRGDKTRLAYVADIKRFYIYLHKELHKVSLQQVVLGDLQEYAESLADSVDPALSIATQARLLATIKSLLTFSYKAGYIRVNVGAALQLPSGKEERTQRILTEEQVMRMIALEEDQRNHALLTVLYGAGLRAAEVCILKWGDVQPRGDTGQLVVYGKRKKTRYVLLKQTTWEELKQLRMGEEVQAYVFQSRQENSRNGRKRYGRKLDESQVLHIVRDAARHAKIPQAEEVSPHWLRHAHASHAIDNGAPISLVQATLGHESIETTATYLHVHPDKSSAQYLKI